MSSLNKKVQELHNKLSEESKRADKLAFEMKRLEEKYEALIKEKEVSVLNESLYEHLMKISAVCFIFFVLWIYIYTYIHRIHSTSPY